MTDEKRRIPIWEQPPVAGRGPANAGVPDASASQNDTEPEPIDAAVEAGHDGAGSADEVLSTTESVVAALTTERDAFYDQLLRQRAEFENYRRRTQKEMGEAEARARGRMLGEFLPILDNLDRALSAAEHHEEGKVLQGVRLTHTLFEDLLRREGVTAIDPVGESFDPSTHEAMVFAPSAEPEGVVTATLERGYALGDRLLRPARVAVSSGAAGDVGA
jgi:molecular chaperone GrpE